MENYTYFNKCTADRETLEESVSEGDAVDVNEVILSSTRTGRKRNTWSRYFEYINQNSCAH